MNDMDEQVVETVEEEVTLDTRKVKSLVISIFVVLLLASCVCVYCVKNSSKAQVQNGNYDIELKGDTDSDDSDTKFNLKDIFNGFTNGESSKDTNTETEVNEENNVE